MNELSIIKRIAIDSNSSTPKYIQVKNAIIRAVRQQHIKPNDQLPSINEASYLLEVSRDTVEKGYRRLKEIGVIESVQGKGFYITGPVNDNRIIRIFFLINELNDANRRMYEAFCTEAGSTAIVDLFVYQNSQMIFARLLENRRHDYDFFVVVPDYSDVDATYSLLETIPKTKRIIVDRPADEMSGSYGVILKTADRQIFKALGEHCHRISNYVCIKAIGSCEDAHTASLVKGISRFAAYSNLAFEHNDGLRPTDIRQGDLYILFADVDLFQLLRKVKERRWEIGNHIGVLSFHDAPFKELLADGISVITSYHAYIGNQAARMMKTSSCDTIDSPLRVIRRNSL